MNEIANQRSPIATRCFACPKDGPPGTFIEENKFVQPPFTKIPRGARKTLLFSGGDITAGIRTELRGKLQGLVSPTLPSTSSIEEEIRCLPDVIRMPWDLKRGPKFDMLIKRNKERYVRQRQSNRLNWEAPDCSTFSKAREISRPGAPPCPLRSIEEPYGITYGPYALNDQQMEDLKPHTDMMVTSLEGCIDDVLAGRAALLESPIEAYTWALQEAIKFAALPGVLDVLTDNCMLGGDRKKGSRLRTNVPEFAQLSFFCSGDFEGICDRTGVLHKPYYQAEGAQLFAKDEAEYPDLMCDKVADIWVLQGVFRRFQGSFLFGEHYSGKNAPLTRAMARAWIAFEEIFAADVLRHPLPPPPRLRALEEPHPQRES